MAVGKKYTSGYSGMFMPRQGVFAKQLGEGTHGVLSMMEWLQERLESVSLSDLGPDPIPVPLFENNVWVLECKMANEADNYRVRVGDWVVIQPGNTVEVVDPERFDVLFKAM